MLSKRLLDICIAVVALTLTSPLFALIALAIWLEDGAPVLFRQRRLGRGGRVFQTLKFRKFSNVRGGEGSLLTSLHDHRYSRVGYLLERTKLNELPQLFNVLRGDMSIVGPRPEIEAFANCFSGPYARLLDFQPGIFGPSQTKFRNEAALYPVETDAMRFYEHVLFPAKARLDLDYYTHATRRSDLYWIVRSLLAVLADINWRPVALSSRRA